MKNPQAQALEDSINKLMYKMARKLRAAFNEDDTVEIERLLLILEKGLEKDEPAVQS